MAQCRHTRRQVCNRFASHFPSPFAVTHSPSDEHPGDAQYLKMLQEERALSKGSRNRHPVPPASLIVFLEVTAIMGRCETVGYASQTKMALRIGSTFTPLQSPLTRPPRRSS